MSKDSPAPVPRDRLRITEGVLRLLPTERNLIGSERTLQEIESQSLRPEGHLYIMTSGEGFFGHELEVIG